MRRYTDYAETRSEAEEKALALLLQYAPGATNFKTISQETRAKDGATIGWTLTLQTEQAEEPLPTVYINVRTRETSEKLGSYALYLFKGYETLPFYFKHIANAPLLLPLVCPLAKPDTMLLAEEVHTPKGRRLLDNFFSYGEGTSKKTEEAIALFRDAPKEMKIYALFENFGELSLQEVKESLEAGEYDGGGVDGELVLAELTGKTYETEEKYLSGLSEICGEEVVNKYKSYLLDEYRFSHVYYYVNYLQYTLSLTEDYKLLSEQEPELARRYGFQPKLLEKMLGRSYRKGATALDVALAGYLSPYYTFRSVFDGLTLGRIAEYLRAPVEKLQEVDAKGYKDSLLASL